MEQILGPGGAVALHHPCYEDRPGQVRMAQAVAAAIDEGRHLCVEAGTGTGKTLAYLLPAIFSGKRVVISTATKNLQEQLFFKDVPFLERALDRLLSVCYMKGRSNYLCLSKLDRIDGEAYLFSPHDPEYIRIIKGWARTTKTGDRAELSDLPEDLPLWRLLDARRETCAGQKCRNFEHCFVTLVRQKALESDIVIVNHHLFFADLALRQGDFGAVLPDYAVLVFDEAHEIEDVATQYFGTMVSNYRIEELVQDAGRVLVETGGGSAYLSAQLARLTERSKAFFSRFAGRGGRFVLEPLGDGFGLRRGVGESDILDEAYRGLRLQLDAVKTGLADLPVASESLEALVRRARELENECAEILESESDERVYWCEVRGQGVFLRASPIDIAPLLEERLFAQVESSTCRASCRNRGRRDGCARRPGNWSGSSKPAAGAPSCSSRVTPR